jgi:hypothetical protein
MFELTKTFIIRLDNALPKTKVVSQGLLESTAYPRNEEGNLKISGSKPFYDRVPQACQTQTHMRALLNSDRKTFSWPQF